ncbi:MAG: hypothetical protein ABSE28_01365 [Candidatus Sulfotelmatobacter sp.]
MKDEKKQQIIALGRLGWSLRKIQEATPVRRETISACLRGAGVEIWPPGIWEREGKAKPAIEVITGSDAAKPAIAGLVGPLNPNPKSNPENLSTKGKATATSKPAIAVITDSDAAKPAIAGFAGPLNPNPKSNPENLSTKGKATATSKPAIAVITDFGVGLSGKESENSKAVGSVSTCEPHREIIELGLSRDRNAMAIWQDLVSDYGFQGGYQSLWSAILLATGAIR